MTYYHTHSILETKSHMESTVVPFRAVKFHTELMYKLKMSKNDLSPFS